MGLKHISAKNFAVQTLFADSKDMLRLEKIEFGGIKGKAFSDQVLALFEEFNALFKSVSELNYDPLDTTDKVQFSAILVVNAYINEVSVT